MISCRTPEAKADSLNGTDAEARKSGEQTEDGIRDKADHVTGVQTCALPICPGEGIGIQGVAVKCVDIL